MRPIHWVLIVITAALILLLGFVYLFKPTLVLPMVTIALPENNALSAYQRRLAIQQLDVRARSDGKFLLVADGKELGYVSYNLRSLMNAVNLAEKMSLSPRTVSAIRWIPILFPDLTWNIILVSQTSYSTLPIEITVRFVQG